MKPKKLIRSKIVSKLKPGESEKIMDIVELNKLYALKIREELLEIQSSNHTDIEEFADLMEVVLKFAQRNGFSNAELLIAIETKRFQKGTFSNIVLNNLNPNNPSNEIYFESELPSINWGTKQ